MWGSLGYQVPLCEPGGALINCVGHEKGFVLAGSKLLPRIGDSSLFLESEFTWVLQHTAVLLDVALGILI